MKEFFKNKFNISIMAVFALAIVCLALLAVNGIFYLVFCVLMATAFIMSAIKLTGVKKRKDEVTVDDFYFDATEISYDEDVYFLGEDEKKVPKHKSRLARFDSWAGIITLYIGAVIFIGLFIMALV